MYSTSGQEVIGSRHVLPIVLPHGKGRRETPTVSHNRGGILRPHENHGIEREGGQGLDVKVRVGTVDRAGGSRSSHKVGAKDKHKGSRHHVGLIGGRTLVALNDKGTQDRAPEFLALVEDADKFIVAIVDAGTAVDTVQLCEHQDRPTKDMHGAPRRGGARSGGAR